MNSQPEPIIEVYDDGASLAAAAAEHFVRHARSRIAESGRFSVALSGGSTPRALHERLAGPLRDAVEWPKVHVFWCDERFVPPDDAESNERMARETLLDHVPIPTANIHPVPTLGLTPEEAADSYGRALASFGGDLPRLDLVLLGMGPDGHTASIFPGHREAVAPGEALAIPVYGSPKPPPIRISLSYRTLNAARLALFLIAGADKATAVRAALRDAADPARLPASGVRPTDGELRWLLDRAAAAQL